MEYGSGGGAREIARFLILDKRMPRSLAFCTRKIRDNLRYLCSTYGCWPKSFEMVDHMERFYLSHEIDAIFDYGLHEYIQKLLSLLVVIGRQIEADYRFYE